MIAREARAGTGTGRYRLLERNAMLGTGSTFYVGDASDDLAAMTAAADDRVRGKRAFYSVAVVDVRTGAELYRAAGTA
jgi:hypothetical protein